MKQYLDLLQEIIDTGVEKESGRANMPNTIEISFGRIRMDLNDGFPLLTTKKMFWKGIVHELLWFLRGETNIKYLVDNGVNIWNGDAYRWYCKYAEEAEVEPMEMDKFIAEIKANDEMPRPFAWWQTGSVEGQNYKLGDLGKVYGYQWRNQNGVDQIADIINDLKEKPYSRYKILDGWNKADFRDMALPPCHLLYHFIPRPLPEGGFALDLNMYQRSCDTLLGVPFNIASMSILLMIIAKAVGMKPGVCNWLGGHTHLYMDHIPMAKEQISREPRPLPELRINKEISSLDDILDLTIEDFEIIDYTPHERIKAELFTGVKK